MRLNKRVGLCVVSTILVFTGTALPQQTVQRSPLQAGNGSSVVLNSGKHKLGPGDEIMIMANDAEEISGKAFRIPIGGDITLLNGVGRIHVTGLTVEELEFVIAERLKPIIRTPQVAVNVTALKSQPVTVIGAVGLPGLHQLEGHKTLLEVLTMAGGPKPEAGPVVQVTRKSASGPLPVASAKVLPNGTSVAEININGIVSHPDENIEILTEDIVYVAKGEFVYVIGEVGTPGKFELNGKPGISLLQLIAIVGGPTAAADKENARILRPVPGAPADSLERTEIAVNLKELMSRKPNDKNNKNNKNDKDKVQTEDQMLRPDDILLVPDSYTKGTIKRTLEGLLQAVTGMAIYRL